MKQILFSIIFFALFAAKGFALDTSTAIFDNRIRTLQVSNPDNFMAPPVIRLGTADRLRINFDIIGDDYEYLRYRLIHCNADWQPSRLLESEYVDGFNEAQIEDYAFSSNTYVHYVNYNLEIPDPGMRILASGNYLLQVYPEDEPDDILLQARFSVSENTMMVNGGVTGRTDKGFNSEFQQIYLEVQTPDGSRLNPYQDLLVEVTQNNRPETARYTSHPLRVDGKTAIFDHDQNLIFNASNEFRRFETVRVDYPGMHVDSVRFGGTNYHAYLREDELRTGREYTYDQTQKGRFKIDEYNADDPDLGADYVTVHFTLNLPYQQGRDIYLDGDFTNHRFDSFNRMEYNPDKGIYEKQIPLKQGSYNYQYVMRAKDKTGMADPGLIEGNYFETQNEYLVKVFLKLPGARADRLVGVMQL